MAAKILSFPARTCEFIVHNRCIKDYAWHPIGHMAEHAAHLDTEGHGGEPGVQCRVLAEWEQVFDRMLDVADVFCLSMEEAMHFFMKSIAAHAPAGQVCALRRASPKTTDVGTDDESGMDCIFLHGHLCTKALPRCPGTCSAYKTNVQTSFA